MKFGFVIYRKAKPTVAAEVNYKHGTDADYKSNKILRHIPMNDGVELLTMDDHC